MQINVKCSNMILAELIDEHICMLMKFDYQQAHALHNRDRHHHYHHLSRRTSTAEDRPSPKINRATDHRVRPTPNGS